MPLSLPILAALAPEHNYRFVDMLKEPEKINFQCPSEIIGISYRQASEQAAFELADKYRAAGKAVIFGGPQASMNPHEALRHANAVVIGEAEELWPKLLEDYRNNALKQFYVCALEPFDDRGKSLFQINRLPDLQELPRPNRSLFSGRYDFDMVFASRGCPVNCDFCVVSDIFGKRMRFRPVDEVVDEINSFKNFYYLLDETVFGRPNCYDYYSELYDKLAALPKKRYWTGQINIDAAGHPKGREVIKKAARSGLVYAAAGIESVNFDTLQSSGAKAKMGIKEKDDYINRMKSHIRFIQEQGIFISGWFAVGYENDSLQTYYDSLKFCTETRIMPVFTPVKALYGSRLWKRMQKDKNLQDLNSHITNIKHPALTDEVVAKALNDTGRLGYRKAENFRRLRYHFKLFRKSEKNFNDALYRTIFTAITQKRMKKFIKQENKDLIQRFEQHISL